MNKFLNEYKKLIIIIVLTIICIVLFWFFYFKYYKNEPFTEWINLIAPIIATIYSGLMTMVGVIYTIEYTNKKERQRDIASEKMAYFLVHNELLIFFKELEEYFLIKAIQKAQDAINGENYKKSFDFIDLYKHTYKFSDEFKNNISKIAYSINYEKKAIVQELLLLSNLNDKINNESINTENYFELEMFFRIFRNDFYSLIENTFIKDDTTFEALRNYRTFKNKFEILKDSSSNTESNEKYHIELDSKIKETQIEIDKCLDSIDKLKLDAYKYLSDMYNGNLFLSKDFANIMNFLEEKSMINNEK